MAESETAPEGYAELAVVWLVEYSDPRAAEFATFQVGGFTTEDEARNLKTQLESEGFFAPLRVNMLPIHRRLTDWQWDQ